MEFCGAMGKLTKRLLNLHMKEKMKKATAGLESLKQIYNNTLSTHHKIE